MIDHRSAMVRHPIEVECDLCGELAPAASVKIHASKADVRTFHRFTTADICLACAKRAVTILEGP
jgi:hypothetical protein